MSDEQTTESAAIRVGDQLDSVYGDEHRGTVVKIAAFESTGEPMYHVRRASDGFVWIGWPMTVRRVTVPASGCSICGETHPWNRPGDRSTTPGRSDS